jgi:UDP-N-acetylmuramoyl-tripeptide--D-alanyl-D-alanine ligase
MSLSLSKDQLIAIVGGSSPRASTGSVVCQGVEYDSREVRGGELFIALKGETTHGHAFVKGAFDRGASIFLVEDANALPDFPEPDRLVVVPDTLQAFWTLASWWRRKLGLPVLAITGSVGKTTVKEITASILLQHSRGSYSIKSHNNHVGVPYSICKFAPEHAWAVLEMGMNHAGEISNLTKIAEPTAAAISTIAPAHIEMLGSLEAIARAKLEIVDGLSRGAPLVLNGDSEVLKSEVSHANIAGRLKTQYFGAIGTGVALEAKVSAVESKGLDGVSFRLMLQGEETDVSMQIMGPHNALNAACAALSARALFPSLSLALIKKGLEEFKAPLQRLSVKELRGDRKIVDDAYNANPASMKALFEVGSDLKKQGKRVGTVLADMLELGEFSEKLHREVGEALARFEPAFLVTVGEKAKWYGEEAKKKNVATYEAASPELAAHIAMKLGFDILLVKGSRGMKLEKTVATLLAREG